MVAHDDQVRVASLRFGVAKEDVVGGATRPLALTESPPVLDESIEDHLHRQYGRTVNGGPAEPLEVKATGATGP